MILANVRTPDERKGDLGAQLAATLRATERLKALAERYGADELIGYHGRGHGLFRAADARGARRPARRRRQLRGLLRRRRHPRRRRRQRRAVLDPHARQEDGRPRDRSTSPAPTRRSKGPINAPLSVTASGVYCGLKMAVDPNSLIPPNSGCWRTIEVKAPQGLGGQRGVPRPRRLRQPRDLAPRRRHGDGRAGQLLAEPGDGLQPGHLGDPDARRRRPAHAAGATSPTRRSRAASARGPTRTASTSSPAASPTP